MKRGDVVLVDWPYSDRTGSKLRPAVVVQADFLNSLIDDTILVQITTQVHGIPNTEVKLDPALEPTNVLPFLEECQQVQGNPGELLMRRQAILIGIHLRQPQKALAAVKQIEDGGRHGDTHLFKAGIALIDHDFPSLQSELGEVVRRHPCDSELIQLHRQATEIATGVTPRVAPSN
jgi:hypothetical protein